MNKQQIETNIQELKDKLAELEESLKEPERREPWRPDLGTFFYCTKADGTIFELEYKTDWDVRAYNNGNVFKTKEQAEYYAKKRAARNYLELYALAVNCGWKPDWVNSIQGKYFIMCNLNYKQLEICKTWLHHSTNVFF